METINLGAIDHEQYLTAVIAIHDDGRQRIVCLSGDWADSVDAKCIQAQSELAALRTAMAQGAQGAGQLEADLTQRVAALQQANDLLVNQLAQARAEYNGTLSAMKQAERATQQAYDRLAAAETDLATERAERIRTENNLLLIRENGLQAAQPSGNHAGSTPMQTLRKRSAPGADE